MQYPPDNYHLKLQDAYAKFSNEYTKGRGARREEVERAFRDKMKRAQETPIKAHDPNSMEAKLRSSANKRYGVRASTKIGA
jgi:hypothetical protein